MKREFKKSKRQFNDPKEKELFEATRKALTDFGKVCGIIGRQEELKELHSLNPAFAQQIQYEINANYRRRNKMLLILEDAFLYAFNNDKELLLKKEQQPNREEGCEVRKNV